jgi:hypothetical protein
MRFGQMGLSLDGGIFGGILEYPSGGGTRFETGREILC